MYRKIIVGYDGSDQAQDALALGRQLVAASGAELVVAGVFDFEPFFDTVGWGDTPPPPRSTAEREQAVLEEVRQAAPEVTARAVGSSSPAHGLQNLAEEISAGLIVIGSCRRGRLGRILAGSVGELLLQGSPCAVAIAPVGFAGREGESIRRVGVGFDGHPEAEAALRVAESFASAAGAALKIVAVVRPDPVVHGMGIDAVPGGAVEQSVHEFLEGRVEWALGAVAQDLDAEGRVLRGSPVEMLGEEDVDLMVIGSRRYGPLRTVLLGGVSLPLIRSAGCPVLVVPRGAATADEDARGETGAEVPSG